MVASPCWPGCAPVGSFARSALRRGTRPLQAFLREDRLHALPACWQRFFESLNHLTVLAPDCPGSGAADAPGCGKSPVQQDHFNKIVRHHALPTCPAETLIDDPNRIDAPPAHHTIALPVLSQCSPGPARFRQSAPVPASAARICRLFNRQGRPAPSRLVNPSGPSSLNRCTRSLNAGPSMPVPQCQSLNAGPSMPVPQCQSLNVSPSMSVPQCLAVHSANPRRLRSLHAIVDSSQCRKSSYPAVV